MKLLYVLFEFSFLRQWKLPLGGQTQVLGGFKWLDHVLVSRLRKWKQRHCSPLAYCFFQAIKMNMQTTLTFFTHTQKFLSSVKFQTVKAYALTTNTLFGNFCVLGIIANLAQNSSHITSISVTAAHFQRARSRQYELASFFPAVPSQHKDPTVTGHLWHSG